MKTLLIFFLMCGVCFAQSTKPDIDSNKILTEGEQVQVKEYLRGKIFKELIPAKNDYIGNFDRGTVLFNPEKGVNMFGREVFVASNYSYHKVVIPDGIIIKGVNFSQKQSHTIAITGKNLVFIRCNLNNVEIDLSWDVSDSLAIHSRKRTIVKDGITFIIYEIEKEGKWNEIEREEIFAP